MRQIGCVKLASGVKYFSRAARWVEGGDWVRRCIIWGISEAVGEREVSWRLGGGKSVWGGRTRVLHCDGFGGDGWEYGLAGEWGRDTGGERRKTGAVKYQWKPETAIGQEHYR